MHTIKSTETLTPNVLSLPLDAIGPGLWTGRRLAQLDLYPPESDGIDAERTLYVLHGLLLRLYLFLCLLFYLPALIQQKDPRLCARFFMSLENSPTAHMPTENKGLGRHTSRDSLPLASHGG